jgi:hypothetical protein
MTDVRLDAERRTDSRAVEIVVHVVQEALTVIDTHDPVRNPARCLRQIRRLLDDPNLRIALTRLAADVPLGPASLVPEAPHDRGDL